MKRFVILTGILVFLAVWWSNYQGGTEVGAQIRTPQCAQIRINLQNSGQEITVSNTAITVADANAGRCSLLIHNTSANTVLCRSAGDGAPTTTAGWILVGGASLSLGLEGRELIQCIREGGSDGTVQVAEGFR